MPRLMLSSPLFVGADSTALAQSMRSVHHLEDAMAKKARDGVYRVVDVIGVSKQSWEDAGRRAIETAASSLRDLRIAEVTKMDMTVENGKVSSFRTRVALSFKYNPE